MKALTTLSSAILSVSMASAYAISSYEANETYQRDDKVRYEGKIYKAKWWSLGEKPDRSRAWQLQPSGDKPPKWQSSKAYQGGDKVIFKGKTYKAKWWVSNDRPDKSNVWVLQKDNDSANDKNDDSQNESENGDTQSGDNRSNEKKGQKQGDYPAFVDGQTYQAGDRVTHNGRYYECIVGPWCSQGGDAYSPDGWAGSDAWKDLGKVSDDQNDTDNQTDNEGDNDQSTDSDDQKNDTQGSENGDNQDSKQDDNNQNDGSTNDNSTDQSAQTSGNNLPSPAYVGYWHGSFNNGAEPMTLAEVNQMGFNMIDVAFGLIDESGHVSFKLDSGAYAGDKAQLKQDIAQAQSQGSKVLLALGGQGARWDGLTSQKGIDNFVDSIQTLMNEYGFDGVDLDNEDSGMLGSEKGLAFYKQAILALRKALGQDKIITITPFAIHVYNKSVGNAENDYVSGAYNLYRRILKDDKVMAAIDAVQPMAYNDWIGGCDDGPGCEKGSQEYLEAVYTNYVNAFEEYGIDPEKKLIMGMLSTESSGVAGHDTTNAENERFVKCTFGLAQCDENDVPEKGMAGVMTWSANWDETENGQFAAKMKSWFNNAQLNNDTEQDDKSEQETNSDNQKDNTNNKQNNQNGTNDGDNKTDDESSQQDVAQSALTLQVNGLPTDLSNKINLVKQNTQSNDVTVKSVTNGKNQFKVDVGNYHVFSTVLTGPEGHSYKLVSNDQGQSLVVEKGQTDFYVLDYQKIDRSQTSRVGAYFTQWSIYDRNYQVTDIPAHLVDDIYYAFVGLKKTGEVALLDKWADINKHYEAKTVQWGDKTVTFPKDKWSYSDDEKAPEYFGNFRRLNILQDLAQKHLNKQINLFLSIGGWTKSKHFPEVAADPKKRQIFVESAIDMMQKYGFNGIDLDWEHPVIGPKASYDKPKPQEAEDFLALIKAFREALDKLEEKTGQRYFLTAAVNAAPQNMQHINYSKLHKHMDWINLMSYDYDGTWDNDTGHHSPLNGYKSSTDPDFSDTEGKWNTRSAVEHMLSEGVPSHKLVIGMPLYARGWSNVGATNNGLFQQTAKAAPGEFEDGIVGYNCLMGQTFADTTTSKCDDDFDFNAIKHTHTDYNGQGQYVGVYYYNPKTNLFYSYDDAESIQNKADFVENYDLGGGMFWSLDGDAPQKASFPSLVETFHHSVHDKPLPQDAKQWIQNKSN